MRKFWAFIAAVAGALLLCATTSRAQTVVTPTEKPAVGRILLPDASVVPPNTLSAAIPKPNLPERDLPPEVRTLLRRFEAARQRYLEQQEKLRKEFQGATTDSERQAIREKIQDSLRLWREEHQQLRDEAIERVREIKRQAIKLGKPLGEDVRPTSKSRHPGLDKNP